MELTNDCPVPVRSVHAERPAALHAVSGLHPGAESEGSGTQRNRRRHDRRRRSVSHPHPQILNIEENTGSIQPSSIPHRFLDVTHVSTISFRPLELRKKYNRCRCFASQLCPTACLLSQYDKFATLPGNF